MKAAEVPHGTEFLSKTTILELLSSIIRFVYDNWIFSSIIPRFCSILILVAIFICSNPMADSILRSRSMMICGRLLSKEKIYMFIDEPSNIMFFHLSSFVSICIKFAYSVIIETLSSVERVWLVVNVSMDLTFECGHIER